MSTDWYRAMFNGACVGWVAYHGTSDIWLTGIVTADSRAAGNRGAFIGRTCSVPDHPLHWVELWDEYPIPPAKPVRMLACLECHALEPPPWSEDDWYSDYSPEQLKRLAP